MFRLTDSAVSLFVSKASAKATTQTVTQVWLPPQKTLLQRYPLAIVIVWVWLLEALLHLPVPALAPVALWILLPCVVLYVDSVQASTRIACLTIILTTLGGYAYLFVEHHELLVFLSLAAREIRGYVGWLVGGGAIACEIAFCAWWTVFFGSMLIQQINYDCFEDPDTRDATPFIKQLRRQERLEQQKEAEARRLREAGH